MADEENTKQDSEFERDPYDKRRAVRPASDSNDLVEQDIARREAEEQEEQAKSSKGKLKAGAAMGAATTGAKVGMGLAMALMLKKMMMMAGQAIASAAGGFFSWLGGLASKAFGAVKTGFNAVVGFAQNLFTGAVAIAQQAPAVVLSATMTFLFTVGSILGITSSSTQVAQRDGEPNYCAIVSPDKFFYSEYISGDRMEVGFKVYSTLSYYGIEDFVIAGILGNFESESRTDPTTLEGYHQDHFQWTEAKARIYETFGDDHCPNLPYDPPYGAGFMCGIGLGQWSGSRHNDLVAYASSIGRAPYELEAQLAFMLGYGPEREKLDKFLASDPKNVEDATFKWASIWEVCRGCDDIGGSVIKQRINNAEFWANEIAKWQDNNGPDKTYAESIFDIADQSLRQLAQRTSAYYLDRCDPRREYDNSSIALSASSYAHTWDYDAVNNDGTEIYQAVVKGLAQGVHFQSCDTNSFAAVRWPGWDMTFPRYLRGSDASGQYYYLRNSDKWEPVGWTPGADVAILRPGDIFNCTKHTAVHTGHEAIVEFHPVHENNPNKIMVGASHPGYSYQCVPREGASCPGHLTAAYWYCVPDDSYYASYTCKAPHLWDPFPDNGQYRPVCCGQMENESGGRSAGVEEFFDSEYRYREGCSYEAFRNIDPDYDDRYKDLIDGIWFGR